MFDITQLKNIRRKIDLTQSQFAKKAGVSQSLIAKIEAGKIDPTFSKVKKIEDALMKITHEQEAVAKSIMISNVTSVNPNTKTKDIISILNKHAISQVPVIEDGNVRGIVYESNLLEKSAEPHFNSMLAKDIMAEAPPIVTEETKISVVSSILKFYPILLVSKDGRIAGLITKSDLLKSLL
ncbi:MAG: CBS domain-containing protein [Candidatus Woesearchaeota archaeon]